MIKTTLSAPFAPFAMSEGIPYMLEDVNAGQFMQIPGMVEAVEMLPAPRGIVDPGSIVVIHRPGGIGDLLMLTPLIEHLARRGFSVHVCTSKTFFPVLAHNPHVDGLHTYPMTEADFRQTPNHIWMENAIEGNPDAEDLHMVDVFFRCAGYACAPVGFPLHCRLYPRQVMPQTEGIHMGLHLTASARNRQYNRGAELVDTILEETPAHVHLYGAPGEINARPDPRVHNHTAGPKPFTLEQTLSHIQTLSGFVGVDSGLLHAAGGYGVPCVALYAAFPPPSSRPSPTAPPVSTTIASPPFPRTAPAPTRPAASSSTPSAPTASSKS